MMRFRARMVGALLSAVIVTSAGAGVARADDAAASSVYGADSLSFERWCTEIQHFDATRCSARQSADVANYQNAKSKLSAYEIEYDKEQRQDREFKESFGIYQSPDIGDPYH